MQEESYPCPACGFLVFGETSGSYEICPVCNWEDDHVQLRFPAMGGGANRDSLCEHQQYWLKTIPPSMREYQGYTRAADWRPLRLDECTATIDVPSSGIEYFGAAGDDSPKYYWLVG